MDQKDLYKKFIDAARYGTVDDLKNIVKQGVYVNSMPERATALMWAALFHKTNNLILLLENGADVNITTESGSRVLMVTSQNWSIEMVKILLEYGADVNAKDNRGWTALDYARSLGQETICQNLLIG